MAPIDLPRQLAGSDGARRALNPVEQARIAQAVDAAMQCVKAREQVLA
jgi:hypothetical protein